MHRHFILLFTGLLLLCFPRGQEPRKEKNWLRLYQYANRLYSSEQASEKTDRIALDTYSKIIFILEKKSGQDSVLFDCYLRSGILQTAKKDDQQALGSFFHAIGIQRKSGSIPDSLLFQPFLFTGSAYYGLNNLDSARYCYKLAESLVERYPRLPETERLYNKSGALYYETGDFLKSIQYFRKALSLVESHPEPDPYFIVNYKNNIASAYRKLGDYGQAMDLYKSLLPYNIRKDELLHNIGVSNLDSGNYAEAIRYLQRVGYNSQAKYNDLGRAWLGLKKMDSADRYLQLALQEYPSAKRNRKNFDYGITLRNLGDLMMARGQPALAISRYQSSIIQIDPDFYDSLPTQNPASFQGLHHVSALFDALVGKAAAFRAMNPARKDQNLQHALLTYGAALQLAVYVQKTYQADQAKLFLVNRMRDTYQEAVDLGLQLYESTRNAVYLEQAFSYAENSKASVLLSGLDELSLEKVGGIPQNLVTEEKRLKSALAGSNLTLAQSNDSIRSAGLEKKILDLEILLSAIQEKLDENPRYHQLKFTSRTIRVDSLQKNLLEKDAAILCYYYLKNSLVCFYITKDDFGYHRSELQPEMQKNMVGLRSALNAAEGADRYMIRESSSFLFHALLEPVYEKIKNKKRLIIIPHNEISYIPFEILVYPANKSLMVKQFAISYQYSINFLGSADESRENKNEVLAMAPFTKKGLGQAFPVLEASEREVAALKGRVLTDSQATRQAFQQWSPSYSLVHLATHAVANDQAPLQSFIEFYGHAGDPDTVHRLYEAEIYQLNLSAVHLVILSACETGNGQLVHGEGIMSLSRAFSYAGCGSVITSLWKADDEATMFITQRLHAYLQKGYRKDEALQKAKSDYLESPDIEDRRKSPAYWAQLVLIGDIQPMHKKDHSWYWLAGLAIILVTAFLIKKNRAQGLRPA
jgi:CHAT domain-containing protein/Tfp pilus assembly protein PilF